MDRRIFLLCLSALFATPAQAEGHRLFVIDTSDGFLNLRSGPGTSHDILNRLYGGVSVDVEERSGSWALVAVADGTKGWVSTRFLSETYSQRYHFDAHVAQTSDGFLNLREGPGSNYPVVQRLYPGTGVNVGDIAGDWYQVFLADGRNGWIHSRFLE